MNRVEYLANDYVEMMKKCGNDKDVSLIDLKVTFMYAYTQAIDDLFNDIKANVLECGHTDNLITTHIVEKLVNKLKG